MNIAGPADPPVQPAEIHTSEPVRPDNELSRRRWYQFNRSARSEKKLEFGPDLPTRMQRHRLSWVFGALRGYLGSGAKFVADWRFWIKPVSVIAGGSVVVLVAFAIAPDIGAEIRKVVPKPGPTKIAKPSSSNTRPSSSPTVRRSPGFTGAPTDPQTVALKRLGTVRGHDRLIVSLSNQWVAQLASKTPGIIDLWQTTAAGGHTFEATDILHEYNRDHQNPNFGSHVRLLLSTDFGGQQLYGRQPLWVTFVELNSFSSAQDVSDWCAQEFPGLPQQARDDFCVARQLTPPTQSD